jgi:YHS domain-containing protein
MFLAHQPTRPGPRRHAVILLAMLAFTATGAVARAGVPWHPTIAQAKAASQISHRPVLVVFTARWSEASMKLEQTALASNEAVALVTACFEPVRIDVDSDPETTRRMGVSYLPTACVVDVDERVLAMFDCPDSSSGFVAAAGRAAQDAALAKATATPVNAAPASIARSRGQSDFSAATTASAAAAAAVPVPAAPSAEETLPKTPPGWAAETPATPLTTSPAAVPATAAAASPGRQSIEPALPQPDTSSPPWLEGQKADTRVAGSAAEPPAAGNAPPTSGQPTPQKPSATAAFLSALQKPFTVFSRPAATTAPPSTPQTAGQPASAAAAADPFESMPVGLEGYCPVTLAEKAKWVEGRAQWGVRHRGRTYLFAGPEQQKAFLADPDRYAPALSGDDPVVATDSGKSTPGQRRYGVTYQTRMYLFSSPENRAAFAANPQRYTSRVAVAEQPSSAGGAVVR